MQTVETLTKLFFERTPSVEDKMHVGGAILEVLMALYRDFVCFAKERATIKHADLAKFMSSREDVWINFCKSVNLPENGMFRQMIRENSPKLYNLWLAYISFSKTLEVGLSA